jgi:hypothetical protein
MRRTFAFTFVLLGCLTTRAFAQGGPPMITDDPGTPGDGHWEVNFAATAEHNHDETESELPLIDINYGVGERIQLKYEVPFVVAHERGEGGHSEAGSSLAGVKWRFFDAGEHGWQVSTYPQAQFRHDYEGFLAPVEVMKGYENFSINFEVGRFFDDTGDGDTWEGGAVVGHEVSEHLEVMGELHSEATSHLNDSQLILNTGMRFTFSERSVLLLAIGRELHNNLGGREGYQAYAGWQVLR